MAIILFITIVRAFIVKFTTTSTGKKLSGRGHKRILSLTTEIEMKHLYKDHSWRFTKLPDPTVTHKLQLFQRQRNPYISPDHKSKDDRYYWLELCSQTTNRAFC